MQRTVYLTFVFKSTLASAFYSEQFVLFANNWIIDMKCVGNTTFGRCERAQVMRHAIDMSINFFHFFFKQIIIFCFRILIDFRSILLDVDWDEISAQIEIPKQKRFTTHIM